MTLVLSSQQCSVRSAKMYAALALVSVSISMSFASSSHSSPALSSSTMSRSSGNDMVNTTDWSRHSCGERISNALKTIHPYGCAKLVSRDTGISQRTVERLLDGSGAPSLENFARLLAAYPSLLLVLAPVVTWAPLATAAVEQEIMQTRMIETEIGRQRAVEAMRGNL